MTHEDAGHYAAKHSGAALNPNIAETLKNKITAGKIPCGAAHATARDLKVTPGEVGVTIDLLEARIVQCQLGLFGDSGRPKNSGPSSDIADSLGQAIRAALVQERLPCAAAWKIAESFNIAKNKVKDECDRLNIKINGCQLGAFK
jgi:hypothetical protein